jgi:hypothetical protein
VLFPSSAISITTLISETLLHSVTILIDTIQCNVGYEKYNGIQKDDKC